MSQPPARVRFIEHRGVPILYHDFSGIADPRDALAPIAEARRMVASRPPRSVRTLVDVRGSHFNADVSRALQELSAHNKPYVVAGPAMTRQREHPIRIRAAPALALAMGTAAQAQLPEPAGPVSGATPTTRPGRRPVGGYWRRAIGGSWPEWSALPGAR
jgi:hypothetical protein